MINRQPIVVVLGHVDHGKTTLLDALRKTTVADREAGGITQAIGASVVVTPSGKPITFIDTPGHAAFTKMRGRGAKVADIAILVVAQDDGVKPQTKEALQIIKDTKIPFIVAGTKADVNGVTPEVVLGQLEKEEVFFEGRGGQVPFISVSAKNNIGLTELLETLILMSEVAGLNGDEKADLEAVVIESGQDKMGKMATVVVRNGSIKVGQTIYTEEVECKVRALIDDKGKPTKLIKPGEPARVFGFNEVPPVGAFVTNSAEKAAAVLVKQKGVFDLRRLADDEIPIVLKADNAGALEAIIAALPPKIIAISTGVGDVNGSDILAASSSKAYVFVFESKIPNDIAKLAEAEKVKVARFTIIYELLQNLDEILKKGLVDIKGHAQILASFPFNNKKVAGSKVIDGKLTKGDSLLLMRGEKEVGKSRISSIKKQKQEVGVVGQGEECGIILEPQLDFEIGDVLVSVSK
ncbi:MAG TPA: translation initiation factor IF-2 [Patescibacteria group bacterium]|nr:translation initiation factor IF-2 [Patescibacteria group bacterium]